MKKKYIAPEAEILLLRLSDIIVASFLDGPGGGGVDNGGEGDNFGDDIPFETNTENIKIDWN